MDATTQVLGLLVIVLALSATMITTQIARRRRALLRPIPAYQVIPEFVGFAIESNRPLQLSFGSSSLTGPSTLLTLASAELFYQITQRNAVGDVSPLITMSNTSTLPFGQDTLRRAYQSRGRIDRFRNTSVRWYPAGARSLTYAAAIASIMGDDRVSANVFAGQFGSELALMMEAGLRRDLPSIAVSDQLEGQAIAFVFADYPLIGEEIFQAGAYLSESASQMGQTIAIDLLRWVLIAVLLILMALSLLNGV